MPFETQNQKQKNLDRPQKAQSIKPQNQNQNHLPHQLSSLTANKALKYNHLHPFKTLSTLSYSTVSPKLQWQHPISQMEQKNCELIHQPISREIEMTSRILFKTAPFTLLLMEPYMTQMRRKSSLCCLT